MSESKIASIDSMVSTDALSTESITEEYFKSLVAEYVKLNDEIKTLGTVIRSKREKQTSIGQVIMEYTTHHGIEGIALDGQYSGMKLITETHEKEQSVGKKGLMDIVQDKLKGSPAQLKAIMEAIANETEIVEVDKVKISKATSGKSKAGSKNKKAYGNGSNNEDKDTERILLDGLPVPVPE